MKLLGIVIAIVLALAAGAWKVYDLGVTAGKATCQAAHAQASEAPRAAEKARVQGDIKRGVKTGAKHERQREALDRSFTALEKEQAHAPADPVDACVLPSDRLRVWRDANAGGADTDLAPAQLDGASAPAAPAGDGAHARPGGESPAGREGVPPAGLADMPAAGLPADQPPRMPGL